jgi:IMP dehydrogenase
MKHGYGFDDVLLVPQYSDIGSRTEPDVSNYLCTDTKVSAPIIVSNMDCLGTEAMRKVFHDIGGGFIWHRFVDENILERGEFITLSLRDFYDDPKAWQARLERLGSINLNYVIDIAHAHAKITFDAIALIRKLCSGAKIIVGNIATREAARDFCMEGVDAIKVNIGNGSACSTRLVTGVGYPSVSAIKECAKECRKFHIPLIGDGGIRGSSDIAKAIAAGANTVMVGKLFAGCDEAGGDWCWSDGISLRETYDTYGTWDVDAETFEEYVDIYKQGTELYRKYWGQSSLDYQQVHFNGLKEGVVPEGFTTYVQYSGKALNVIKNLIGGLKSAMTYCGARSIAEFQRKAKFVKTSHIKEL